MRCSGMQFINELFSLMTLVKMGSVVLITVALSLLAESVSPKMAGFLTGFPLGAAVSIFFMGFEISPNFAAESALHTSAGVAATVVFSYCYWRVSAAARELNCVVQILLACFVGSIGYLAAVFILSYFPSNLLLASVLPILSILIFSRIARDIKDVKIDKRVRLSFGLLLVRAFFAASTVVLIISTAKTVGPTWAGLFAAYPNIMLPLVVIIQFTYMPEHAYVIIKNVPKGLISVISYCLTVSIAYPSFGVYVGTAMAYGSATICMLALQFGNDLFHRNRS